MRPATSPIRVAVVGASGRMGRAVLRAVSAFPELAIGAAVVSRDSAVAGQDSGVLAGLTPSGLAVINQLDQALAVSDVAVDFSVGGAVGSTVEACRRARRALLIGTTGYPSELEESLTVAARDIPLLIAPNTSIAVAVLLQLVGSAARALPRQFDIEIIEAHHRTKRDAPSGTALALGRAASEGRGWEASGAGDLGRGRSLRQEGEIGFASVRAGDLVGEHTVLFAGEGERLSLSHQATDRAVFARGALRAVAWLALQPAGRYSMVDFTSSKS